MNIKTDGQSSSNEEVQSSGISSMSDETPPSENGTNFTENYSFQPSAERWKDDCYICVPNQQNQSVTDYRYEHAEIAYPDTSHSRQQNIIKPSPVNLGMTKSSAFSPRSMPHTIENQFHAIKEPPSVPGAQHYPNQTYNSVYEIDKSLLPKPSLFQSGFQVYTPYGDMERPYILDSDLETIEEESSVLESDFDDRGSVGYDRKRSSIDFKFHRKHERTGSNTTSNSMRDSVASATASDDERSSSTGSSRSAARSSWSSWGEPGTPRNESTSRNSDTESSTPSKSSLHKQSTPRRIPSYEMDNPVKITICCTEVAAIDPNAQQKIVYAKCLSPKEAAKSRNNTPVKIINHISPTQVNNIPQSPKRHPPVSHQPQQHSTAFRSVPSKKELTITDMFEAVRNGDLQTLNKFSPPEQSETVDESGNTVLHAAAEAGQLQCVRLLATSTCVNAISLLDDDLMTPAALSVKNGHLCCVQWLVQNTVAKEELIVSSRQSSIDGSNMRPPLAHVAARFDQDAVLDWLCEEMSQEKYSIDSADHHSNTSVHEAAAHGHLKCLQTLVGRGASVTVLNSNGDTPGQVADKNGHELCVGYLVVVESCMSLAQQLVTMKIDMEGLRKDNENLRNQVKSHESARIAQAKDSVDQRINAALQKLSPHQEDNEMDDITPHDASIEQWSKGVNMAERKVSNFSQLSPQYNGTIISKFKPVKADPGLSYGNNHKDSSNTLTTKHQTEQNNALTNGIISDHSGSINDEDIQRENNKASSATAGRQGNRDYDGTGSMENDLMQNGHSEQSHDNEIENLTKNIKVNRAAPVTNNSTKTQAGRAWDKMTTEEMLRMARDTRYLPSPTVSMCTEDSTMETREVMRERLAEASRWFLGQQLPAKKKVSPIKDPRVNLYQSHQRPPTQTDSPHSASPGTSRNQKSMSNTASWVRDVQRSKVEPRQQRNPGISNVYPVPQQFVTATNQQFKKLQLASNIYNKIQTKESAEKNDDLQRYATSSSSSERSLVSASSDSPSLTSKNNTLSSTTSSVFLRPASAESSCSTTSMTRSSQFNSSSSSISTCTVVSQGTVVEPEGSGAPTRHLRSNADMVEPQVRDPLKKQRAELSSRSQLTSSTSSITGSVTSSISAPFGRQQDSPSRPTSAKVTPNVETIVNQTPQNRFSASDPAEIRTVLPSRNNSFLRRVQPSSSYPQQMPYANLPSFDSSSPSLNTNVVTYPTITTKPSSPADKRNFPQNVQRTTPISPQKSFDQPSHVQYSSSTGMMQKVEIVHPAGKSQNNEPRRNVVTNGRSFVMWKPSTTQIIRKEDVRGPKAETTQESPKLTRKNKGSKHSKNKGDKEPYGGIFTSLSSPKSSSKKKPTKLFQI